jgi:hypothetical protein
MIKKLTALLFCALFITGAALDAANKLSSGPKNRTSGKISGTAADATNKAYIGPRNRTFGKISGTKELETQASPTVPALTTGTSTRQEAPQFESTTSNVPSLAGSELGQRGSTSLSRGDFLTETQKGRQLRSSPSIRRQNAPVAEPWQQPWQQPSGDGIRNQMAQRSQTIAPTSL